MSELIVNNKIIHTNISDILKRISIETGYLDDIHDKTNSYMVTCPFHKDGHERKPACGISKVKNEDVEVGTFHCFACGARGPLSEIVNKCYGRVQGDLFGEEWLIENYSDSLIDYQEPLVLINTEKTPQLLDEALLDNYEYGKDTPASIYLTTKRHLSQKVIDFFKIGYDKEDNSIVFPVNNIQGKLAMISKRNVDNHKFNFISGLEKPIYLLDTAIKNHYSKIIVCESQINALTCYTYGYPAIALMGTGSKTQLEQLKKSGIREFILMFDGDLAGRHGAMRFKKTLDENCLIYDIEMPSGQDVNDISYNKFLELINSI